MRRKERAREHHQLMADSDRIYEQAEAPSRSDTRADVTRREAPPPPAAGPSLLPQAPAPRPPHNRRLKFASDAEPEVNLPAAAEPVQERLPTLAHHEENKTAVLQDKVNDWRQRCASPQVATAPDRYPTPPSAPDDDGLSSYTDSLCEGGRRYTANYKGPEQSTRLTSKHLLVRHRDRVWVHKEHRDPRGLAPLCYVATGYQGPRAPDGEHHHAYLCYDDKDIMWARRLKFHLKRQ